MPAGPWTGVRLTALQPYRGVVDAGPAAGASDFDAVDLLPLGLVGGTLSFPGHTGTGLGGHQITSIAGTTIDIDPDTWDGTLPDVGWIFQVSWPAQNLRLAANPQLGSIHGFVENTYSYTPNPINGVYIGQNEYSLQQSVDPTSELEVSLTDLLNGDQMVYANAFFAKNPDQPPQARRVPDRQRPARRLLAGRLGLRPAGDPLPAERHRPAPRPDRHGHVASPGLVDARAGLHLQRLQRQRKAGSRARPAFPASWSPIASRENNLFEQGTNLGTSDMAGHYELIGAYPIGQWTVLEAYADAYKNTGITVQSGNDPAPQTYLGAGVDVNFIPWITQGLTVDWGKQAYKPDENGGIVGSVSYGTTRNELNPEEAAIEDWQPGIPGLTVHMYRAAKTCTPAGSTDCTVVHDTDGTIMVQGRNGQPVNPYTDQAEALDAGPPTSPRNGPAPSTATLATPRARSSPTRGSPSGTPTRSADRYTSRPRRPSCATAQRASAAAPRSA